MTARRTVGLLLAVARRALVDGAQAPTAAVQRRVVATAVARLRGLVDARLLTAWAVDAAPVPALLGRLRERLAVLRGLAGPANDDFARLLLLEADCAAVAGDLDGALRLLRLGVARLSLVQSYVLRDALLLRFFDMARALGGADEAATTWLCDLADRRQMRSLDPEWVARLQWLVGQRTRLGTPGLRRAAAALRPIAWIAGLNPRRVSALAASFLLHRLARPRIRRALVGERAPSAAGPVAVRAMGGAGDMLMMTPGLRALARRRGAPVTLLVPAGLAALFEMNPDVTVRAIETLDEAWRPPGDVIDLTDCPAVAGELPEYPDIRTNRIALFATGLGVTPAELDRFGRQPFFEPTPAAAGRARAWLQANRVDAGGFIAVQAQPAENYRIWPAMPRAAALLAATLPVVVFHDRPLPGYDSPGVIGAFGLVFGDSLAIACQARAILAPDSAFLHLAGARRIPSVSVFGPTSGRTRTSDYPEARFVAQTDRFACIPCWRGEVTPCPLTGGMRSVCLDTLDAEVVVRAVHAALV